MRPATLLKIGLVGAGVSAVCCFTPLLVVLFSALGLAAWSTHLDVVLQPSLLFFILLTIYGVYRQGMATGKPGRRSEGGSS
ncbi:MAG: mercury resistance system transport protein MerF [Zetaproteobacteria bacterium]|nr:MAG: mercury resistance system transport protein MerF [Zetaproteobacteria bacterium]